MANRAVIQPNGFFARFSDVVDEFTHVNLTEDEMLAIYTDEIGRFEAIGKVERAKKAPERFERELATIAAIHGKEAADERRKQCSDWSPPMADELNLEALRNALENRINKDHAATAFILAQIERVEKCGCDNGYIETEFIYAGLPGIEQRPCPCAALRADLLRLQKEVL